MYIHVKAHPKSKKEEIVQLKEDHFEIWVKEPAEKNLANKKIIEILKNNFSESKSVRIISGHHSPSKLFLVDFEE
jgi:uncharacterized protein (TIGR00251 family)